MDTEALPEPQSVDVGFSNQTPFCQQAEARVRESVTLGMSPKEVRAVVGKPLKIFVGTIWSYGRGVFTPEVTFTPGATIQDSIQAQVTGWDLRSNSCDNEADAFIEAANALALEGPGADHTNDVLSCLDAGLRIQAFVEVGMTEAEVLALVGKPVRIFAGSIWDYGERPIVPDVQFTPTTSGKLVIGYDSNSSGCE